MGEEQALHEQRWEAWLLQRNRRGLRYALRIAVWLYPAFGVLDYLIAPRAWLWLLYATRLLVLVITVIMLRLVDRPWFERRADVVSMAYMVLVSVGISLMTVFMGALSSPYYAGLTLTIVGAGLLYVWPVRTVLVCHATIIASFVLPNLLLRGLGDPVTSVSNLVFLTSTAIIVGTGQVIAYQSQREQVQAQLVIETTKKNLERAHEQLQQLDRFKSEFFANITHELKTPLAMILTPLELLIDGEFGSLSQPQLTTMEAMQRNGMKLLRLIRDLLDLSKLEESRLRLRIAEHEMVSYLQGLVAQVQPLAARKSIQLTFVTQEPTCPLYCDLERMERVFINLLSNATKFTPPGGEIRVVLASRDESVELSVEDTGIGFPPEMAERIFERFFQVDSAGTRKVGGAGIGLSLAKELVLLHGGTLVAESQSEQGAAFRMSLRKGQGHFRSDALDRRRMRSDVEPGQRVTDRGLLEWEVEAQERFRLLEIDEATEQRVVGRDRDEDARAHTVLVVEDTPDIIRLIHLALHHDFRVIAAPNGQKGLELALEHRPSLIITDWMMPEIDGLELTRRLRGDPKTAHAPIVMLTARDETADRIHGWDTGVNAYLAKPFSPKELLATVRSLLDVQEATADAMLRQSLDSLESIAGALAHEIKNPLNYIGAALTSIERDTGALQDLMEQAGPMPPALQIRAQALRSRSDKMVHTALSGVRRIGSTVELMLRYAREGYSRTVQPYDVQGAVADVIELVVPATGKDVEVTSSFHGDGTVECVPEELHCVLSNVLQNAIEACPGGDGRVSIVVEGLAEVVEISVRDNGAGIAPADLRKIFTPFFTTKDVGQGLGMGLTIVRRVVASLGGSVHALSTPGNGTVLRIRLPRTQAAGPTSSPPPVHPVLARSRSTTHRSADYSL